MIGWLIVDWLGGWLLVCKFTWLLEWFCVALLFYEMKLLACSFTCFPFHLTTESPVQKTDLNRSVVFDGVFWVQMKNSNKLPRFVVFFYF